MERSKTRRVCHCCIVSEFGYLRMSPGVLEKGFGDHRLSGLGQMFGAFVNLVTTEPALGWIWGV